MYKSLNTIQDVPLPAFAHSFHSYEVRDLVAIFYNASHKKKSVDGDRWLANLELQLERLRKHQYSKETWCATLQLKWQGILKNLIQAISKFEVNYKANCPCAGLLPSPYFKRLQGIQKNANLALFYIEV